MFWERSIKKPRCDEQRGFMFYFYVWFICFCARDAGSADAFCDQAFQFHEGFGEAVDAFR